MQIISFVNQWSSTKSTVLKTPAHRDSMMFFFLFNFLRFAWVVGVLTANISHENNTIAQDERESSWSKIYRRWDGPVLQKIWDVVSHCCCEKFDSSRFFEFDDLSWDFKPFCRLDFFMNLFRYFLHIFRRRQLQLVTILNLVSGHVSQYSLTVVLI
jgi:hypothetical protein